ALQPMLQMFRLLHYERIAASQYPGFLKFPPRLRDSARALAAPMLGNEELQERLAGALESQIHSMRFDRFAEPEWIVMVALYGLCSEFGIMTDHEDRRLRDFDQLAVDRRNPSGTPPSSA